jgi:heterotetrameric sarcosine oxidase gamma subunit
MLDVRVSPNHKQVEISLASDRSIARLVSWKPSDEVSRPLYWQGRQLPVVGEVLEGEPRILCTSPKEWLLVFSKTDFSLGKWAQPDPRGERLVLVEVTAGLGVLELRGRGAVNLLAKSCGLNFSPHVFGASRCARVRCANIPVLIHCVQELEIYQLYVVRSYLTYFNSWITDAAIGLNSAGVGGG